ncbi:DUF368 domain-containing protein [Halovivax limisalsi]|uniref:DUF368 domain-containing protein n=1 Tax=Halovivax limisalsi TaxID=1453760 RepID=UPI001FFD2F54|nr:DUF368 domain-containing protein [Halovivax limisalsi]
MREALTVYLKGFAMGSADVVPGVSGGTIALIVGIYDRLIRAITALDPSILADIDRLGSADGRADLLADLREMDVPFLGALGLGVASAVLLLASTMHFLTTTYPVPTYGFFTGLIAASAVVLYGEVDVTTPARIVVAVVGVVLAVSITGVTAGEVSHALPIVFVAGAIAVCAMILPGVSGSFLLLVLGQYEYMTGTLSEAIDAVTAVLGGASAGEAIDPLLVVSVFLTGAVAGLFSMAHLVRRALDRNREVTMTFLVSLMVGALRLPIERIDGNLGRSTTESPSIAIAAAILGASLVLAANRFAVDGRALTSPT